MNKDISELFTQVMNKLEEDSKLNTEEFYLIDTTLNEFLMIQDNDSDGYNIFTNWQVIFMYREDGMNDYINLDEYVYYQSILGKLSLSEWKRVIPDLEFKLICNALLLVPAKDVTIKKGVISFVE